MDTPGVSFPPPAAGETLDRLAGAWWIYQLRRGHRYATDDLLVAWTALQTAPQARRVLDLGSGVGSVGLLCLLNLGPDAELTAVEVQAASAALCRRTVAGNGLGARVTVREGDLREATLLAVGGFDLVAANPPFFPPRVFTPSPQPQRAAARLELHGDVFAWAQAAARWAPGAPFVFCHPTPDRRPRAALAAAGLRLRAWRELRFRADGPPRLTVYVAGGAGPEGQLETLAVRGADGRFTPEWRAVRRALLIEA